MEDSVTSKEEEVNAANLKRLQTADLRHIRASADVSPMFKELVEKELEKRRPKFKWNRPL